MNTLFFRTVLMWAVITIAGTCSRAATVATLIFVPVVFSIAHRNYRRGVPAPALGSLALGEPNVA